MDKITATKVYEEELREMEFQGIKNIIESYNKPYKPEIQFLLGTIFTFDSYNNLTEMFCDRYYIVTFVKKIKFTTDDYMHKYIILLGNLNHCHKTMIL
jgi:hypothetical protein